MALMDPAAAPAEEYEIRVGGVTRTLRDRRHVAILAARELETRERDVVVIDLRDGAIVPHHAGS